MVSKLAFPGARVQQVFNVDNGLGLTVDLFVKLGRRWTAAEVVMGAGGALRRQT